jgi:hypothetical protein
MFFRFLFAGIHKHERVGECDKAHGDINEQVDTFSNGRVGQVHGFVGFLGLNIVSFVAAHALVGQDDRAHNGQHKQKDDEAEH